MLYFALGLLLGLLLLGWQQFRFRRRFRSLLRHLRRESESSSYPLISQLSMAIAQQCQIQDALRREVERYELILRSAPVGYLQVDDENRLIWCNPQAGQLLGINPEQGGRSPRLLLELVRSYELDHLIDRTRRSNRPCQHEWTFHPVSSDPSRLSQQKPYALRGFGLPLEDECVGIFLENRQELVVLMQQRDRWASDVAHELKTPLTSIRLVAETLHSRLDPAMQGWVERLINETIRLSTLVQDLLDLSQLEQGLSRNLNWQTTDLRELVYSAWLSLEPLARKKNLTLDYEGPDKLWVEVDEARIYRVLINLLDNGIKFSPPWGEIHIRLQVQDPGEADRPRTLCLEIIDEGEGFPEYALPHVFERFYRADPGRSQAVALTADPPDQLTDASSLATSPSHATRSPRSSSGLGLAIVKQIIEAHGGSVAADNHPDWGGGWLRVVLPLDLVTNPHIS
jgi:two-component system phosphate regulon sensor histidine kinase PhoR